MIQRTATGDTGLQAVRHLGRFPFSVDSKCGVQRIKVPEGKHRAFRRASFEGCFWVKRFLYDFVILITVSNTFKF